MINNTQTHQPSLFSVDRARSEWRSIFFVVSWKSVGLSVDSWVADTPAAKLLQRRCSAFCVWAVSPLSHSIPVRRRASLPPSSCLKQNFQTRLFGMLLTDVYKKKKKNQHVPRLKRQNCTCANTQSLSLLAEAHLQHIFTAHHIKTCKRNRCT